MSTSIGLPAHFHAVHKVPHERTSRGGAKRRADQTRLVAVPRAVEVSVPRDAAISRRVARTPRLPAACGGRDALGPPGPFFWRKRARPPRVGGRGLRDGRPWCHRTLDSPGVGRGPRRTGRWRRPKAAATRGGIGHQQECPRFGIKMSGAIPKRDAAKRDGVAPFSSSLLDGRSWDRSRPRGCGGPRQFAADLGGCRALMPHSALSEHSRH